MFLALFLSKESPLSPPPSWVGIKYGGRFFVIHASREVEYRLGNSNNCESDDQVPHGGACFVARSTCQAMDKAYGLTKTGNSEVRFCWHKLCLRAKALFIVPHVLDFVTSMVRIALGGVDAWAEMEGAVGS